MNSLKIKKSQLSSHPDQTLVPSKSKVGDADVIKDEAELGSASHKLLVRPGAHLKPASVRKRMEGVKQSTCSLMVISSPASNSATTCFSTSFVIEGST